ncbi:MAG: efflux RND transporter periplasmic adaptor subunit, partial [bacterium]
MKKNIPAFVSFSSVRLRSSLHLTALSTLLVIAGGCSTSTNASKSGGSARNEAVPVKIGEVTQQDVPLELQAIGSVEAYSTANIRAQVTGIISKVHFKEGQEVRKDDLLFTIDSRSYEAEIAQAQANLARDKVLARNAAKDATRYEDMMSRSAVSPEDYDRIHSNSESLAATVQADEAAIEAAKIRLDYCTIRSPIDGRTGSLLVHEGNLVNANSDNPLVVIHQLQPIRVAFSIPERYLSIVKEYVA